MSESIISLVLSAIVTIITFVVAQGITIWLNKRKVVDDSNLSRVDLAKRYQDMASVQADENAGLEVELKEKEKEKRDLIKKYEELWAELKTMEERHDSEIQSLRDSFASERLENLAWRNWAQRLSMQVYSLGFTPVPLDIEKAKEEGMKLTGQYKPDTK
jgi:septal ring factor EnvC (AmiA/AmiB activator)